MIATIERMADSREDYIASRYEDLYYSDSWEQHAQIREDIEKKKKEMLLLRQYQSGQTGFRSIRDIVHAEIMLKGFDAKRRHARFGRKAI